MEDVSSEGELRKILERLEEEVWRQQNHQQQLEQLMEGFRSHSPPALRGSTQVRQALHYADPSQCLPQRTRFRWAKRMLLRLMQVYSRSQSLYNHHMVQAMDQLYRYLRQARDEERVQARAGRAVFERLREQLAEISTRLDHLEKTKQDRLPEFRLDGKGFQDRFRGPEEEIKERLKKYMGYLEGRRKVLEIGSGRGEFLELCKELSIPAAGVETDPELVRYCRDKGLPVSRADGLDYLKSVPDEDLDALVMIQIIEHLPPDYILELVRVAYQKLAPRGLLLIETINPRTLAVFSRSFFMDLSHRQPLYPDTLQFILEMNHFTNCRIVYSAPVEESEPQWPATDREVKVLSEEIQKLRKLLFGPQDYAIIAAK